jgi:hypothetical protein
LIWLTKITAILSEDSSSLPIRNQHRVRHELRGRELQTIVCCMRDRGINIQIKSESIVLYRPRITYFLNLKINYHVLRLRVNTARVVSCDNPAGTDNGTPTVATMALILLRTFSPLWQVCLHYILVTTNEVSLSMQRTILCITSESRALLLKCDRGLTGLIYTDITGGISPEHYFVYNELNLFSLYWELRTVI